MEEQKETKESMEEDKETILKLLHISASNNGVTPAEQYKKANTCRMHLSAVFISSLPVSVRFRAWLITPDHNMDIRATR